MKATITLRLDAELERKLRSVAARAGRTRSEIVREALRRHLSLTHFEQLRERVMPFAEARGFLTEEDVERAAS
jgi:predicted transcriptional regulator